MIRIKTVTKPIHSVVEDYNWHLRPERNKSNENISKDLKGILIINGVKVIYLNNSAYNYLNTFLHANKNHRLTIWRMALQNKIFPKRAQKDWERLYNDLIQASRGCCEGTGIEVKSDILCFSAPLRVDLALTYRCNNDCTHCYAGGDHQTDELNTEEWYQIIDKLHSFGVPQVIFTGGESLIRPDLEKLIAHAKGRKMITGLITNGRLLTKPRVKSLANAGLDFVQITVESIESKIHNQMVGIDESSGINALQETLEGVQNALNSSIRVTTNTTITRLNASTSVSTISKLIQSGVKRIGVNSIIRAQRGKNTDGISHKEMEKILPEIRQLCLQSNVEMLWFTPTCYQQLNPITLQLGVKSCSAASIVLAIEPTGRVIPCQSYFEGLGDARTDSFEDIWNHPLALEIREKRWVKDSCRGCAHFKACGGGCPLEVG